MREYVSVRRMAKLDEDADAEDYLARTVYEDHELIDIGVMDKNGNPIMARKRLDSVGFIRWNHNT